MTEWETDPVLPDVVRLTFKAFHDVLRVQGDSIKNLERVLDSKASRSEVSMALQSRASGAEMAARLAEVRSRTQMPVVVMRRVAGTSMR